MKMVLDVQSGGDEAYRRIVDCCRKLLEDKDTSSKDKKMYRELMAEAGAAAESWNEPEEL